MPGKLFSVFFTFSSALSIIAQVPSPSGIALAPELTAYVNPFIGTSKMGHTFPGATVPFGMVQLSPDTDTLQYNVNGSYNKDIYKYCAGYQYNDKTIVGFSHTHFSGTGHADLGDLLIMPTIGALQLNPGTSDHPEKGYRSAYSHEDEIASPGYYSVLLQDHQIRAELTATTRTGIHRYTFPQAEDAHIILDLTAGIYNYEGKNIWTFLRIENDTLITGYRQTNGWGRTRTVYFAISLSKPISSYGYEQPQQAPAYRGFWGRWNQYENFPEIAGTHVRAHLDFSTGENESVMLKVALSPVSTENAILNLQEEAPHNNFERYRKAANDLWENELRKIQAEFQLPDDKISFYTAMYHTLLEPTVYSDVDGSYRGLDQNTHSASGFTNYTTFSLWDTYRALHPLFNLIQPERNSDMIRSMLAHYDQSVHQLLPIWSHYANENWCMIGYHSVPVIADAIVNGTFRGDPEKALKACVSTARKRSYDGLGSYMDIGYVPADLSGASVSKTLEYAYDDWCIAQLARKLGKEDLYHEFLKRSENYHHVFDPSSGFMRPRLRNGSFMSDFDVLDTHHAGYIEGNAWNYSLYVPHNPTEMIRLMGGNKRFNQHLDSLFSMELPDRYFEHTEDISRDGIIGNYVHGNEPSHHVAYLYNWSGAPWKTQEKVRMIMRSMYRAETEGLGGNDDCGQMSAWFVFSALGFYPVAPASGEYALGSPLVGSATIKLGTGGYFSVKTKNQGERNVYVKKILLNGRKLDRPFITFEQISQGGVLEFHMSASPSR